MDLTGEKWNPHRTHVAGSVLHYMRSSKPAKPTYSYPSSLIYFLDALGRTGHPISELGYKYISADAIQSRPMVKGVGVMSLRSLRTHPIGYIRRQSEDVEVSNGSESAPDITGLLRGTSAADPSLRVCSA